MIILVHEMCAPSFILIGFCVSELHAHLYLYCNVGLRLFVVLQELHCLPKCNLPIPWSSWISISTQSVIAQLCLVIEIETEDEND